MEEASRRAVRTVQFTFDPHPAGTRLTVREKPEPGPISWPFVRTATLLALQWRNREICRRFRGLAELRWYRGGDTGA